MWSSETFHERLDEILPSGGDPARIEHGAYELSLGSQFFSTGTGMEARRILLADDQVVIPSGQFAHLITAEVVAIPSDTMGLISIKSRFKFGGLLNVSGFHVDPGWVGRLVFSVYNAGPQDCVLTCGEPVFMLWIAGLDQATEDLYDGSGEGDKGIKSEHVARLLGDVTTPATLSSRLDVLQGRVNLLTTLVAGVIATVIAGILVGVVMLLLQRSVTGTSTTETSTTEASTTEASDSNSAAH